MVQSRKNMFFFVVCIQNIYGMYILYCIIIKWDTYCYVWTQTKRFQDFKATPSSGKH